MLVSWRDLEWRYGSIVPGAGASHRRVQYGERVPRSRCSEACSKSNNKVRRIISIQTTDRRAFGVFVRQPGLSREQLTISRLFSAWSNNSHMTGAPVNC